MIMDWKQSIWRPIIIALFVNLLASPFVPAEEGNIFPVPQERRAPEISEGLPDQNLVVDFTHNQLSGHSYCDTPHHDLNWPDYDNTAWDKWTFTNSWSGDQYNVKFRVTNTPGGSDWDRDLYDSNHAMYRGDPYDRDFDTWGYANWGTALSPTITIPNKTEVVIDWCDWHKIEDYGTGTWDECRFHVYDLTTNTYYLLTDWWGATWWPADYPYQSYWAHYTFDISRVAGHNIQIYLWFDTKDPMYNRIDVRGQRVYGWFVDNIQITAGEERVYYEDFEPIPTAGVDIKLKDTIPTWNNLDIDWPTLTKEPYSITADQDTILEWRYPSMKAGQEETIGFDLNLYNLKSEENRLVNKGLELSYRDVEGHDIVLTTPPQYVQVYRSEYLVTISTDKTEYNPNENVLITTNITPPYFPTAICEVQIEDTQGNLVTKVGTIDLSTAIPGQANTYTFTWNSGSTYAGEYLATAILYQGGVEIDKVSTGFTILPLPVEQGMESILTTDKISYGSNENVEITSKVKSLAKNFIYENLKVIVEVINPEGGILSTNERITTLIPEATNTAKVYWNTGTNTPGDYTIKQKVIYQDQVIKQNIATFSIISSVEAKSALFGYIKVEPQSLLMGQSTNFSYQVANIGNVDLQNLTLKVIIVDPETKQAMEGYTYPETGLTLLKGESHLNSFSATINLLPKYYLVILQGEIEDTIIPIASTYLFVKLPATVRIEPESFDQNTGTFTAFVKFPVGFDISTITDATCDGASAYNLIYDSGENQMLLKFRRNEVTVLPIDTHFVVTGHFGEGLTFEGSDDIMKIIYEVAKR